MNKYAYRTLQYFNKFQSPKVKNLKQGFELLAHRSLLEVEGPDSTALLQGLITNDMTTLSNQPHGCIYGMFLNSKGRVLYDSIIYKIPGKENRYLVEVDKSVSLTLCKHLIIHKLRKEVSVKNVDERYQLWVNFDLSSVPSIGASPIEVINKEMEYDVPEVVKSYKFVDPRLPSLGSRIIVHKSCMFVNGYLAVAYRNLRYRLGVPEGTDELPIGNCFPLEANCDYLNGVSFDKGCYLGQELTARTYHTGVIRKRYMPMYIKEKLPNLVVNPNDIVEVNKKVIGKIRGFDMQTGLGIGLLRIKEAIENDCVSVGSLKLITLKPFWWPSKDSEQETVPSTEPIEPIKEPDATPTPEIDILKTNEVAPIAEIKVDLDKPTEPNQEVAVDKKD